jgi:hypothetical protein
MSLVRSIIFSGVISFTLKSISLKLVLRFLFNLLIFLFLNEKIKKILEIVSLDSILFFDVNLITSESTVGGG